MRRSALANSVFTVLAALGVGALAMAALIARNDLRLVPVLAFFLAALKAGALGMERFTGIPKALVDAIIAVFILRAAMEGLVLLRRRDRKEA